MTDAHGRDHVTDAEMAVDGDGKILGLRVDTLANLGAYLSTFAPLIPTYLYGTLLRGAYRIPAIHVEVKAVFTNTDAGGRLPRRGPARGDVPARADGRPGGARARDGPGRDPAQELHPAGRVPVPDAGRAPVRQRQLRRDPRPRARRGRDCVRVRRSAARRRRKRGKLRGIGFSTYIEACGLAPSALVGCARAPQAGLWESAHGARAPHRQGHGLHRHRTATARDTRRRSRRSWPSELGVPLEDVEVVHGDTARIPFGMGTYGSRSLAVGGSAHGAGRREGDRQGAARSPPTCSRRASADIEFADGEFRVAGTDRKQDARPRSPWRPTSRTTTRPGLEPGLEETAFYDPKNFIFPVGCHVVRGGDRPGDRRLAGGALRRRRRRRPGHQPDDRGGPGARRHGARDRPGAARGCALRRVRPAPLGVAHGLRHAAGRAICPGSRSATKDTDCTHNPLGVKGVGETGAIASPPAVINAVMDALAAAGREAHRHAGCARADLASHPGTRNGQEQ